MRLRKHFILANTAVVILPLLITAAACFVFLFVSSWFFHTGVNLHDLEQLAETKKELLNTQNGLLQTKPEMLVDPDFQSLLAEKLSEFETDLVIVKNRKILFTTKKLTPIDLEKCLAAEGNSINNPSVNLGGTDFSILSSPVSFKDGDMGQVLLVTPIRKKEPMVQIFLLFASAVFILSVFVTSGVSALLFSRGIVTPLSRLQRAAGEISRGNLDHTIASEGSFEIQELCNSFEQMRLKLKESVCLQMKYDENRKMLVSSISHDLKTPITSILGYLEGIRDGVANTPEKAEKYLKTVYSKARQVNAMIDDLLLYSKLDLKQIPFNFERTDIVRFIQDCILENETELENKGIHLTYQNELTGNKLNPYILLDRDRMRRVIMNILDNAQKYMDKKQGKITFLLRENASGIIIEISDNGAGIPKEDLPFIFDRFYRADETRGKTSGGGLGLAIASQIVEGHGGSIWAKSIQGQGTHIMISLSREKSVKNKEKNFK